MVGFRFHTPLRVQSGSSTGVFSLKPPFCEIFAKFSRLKAAVDNCIATRHTACHKWTAAMSAKQLTSLIATPFVLAFQSWNRSSNIDISENLPAAAEVSACSISLSAWGLRAGVTRVVSAKLIFKTQNNTTRITLNNVLKFGLHCRRGHVFLADYMQFLRFWRRRSSMWWTARTIYIYIYIYATRSCSWQAMGHSLHHSRQHTAGQTGDHRTTVQKY